MANPNAITGNGGDLTVGHKLFLPNAGLAGRLLTLDGEFAIVISDLAADNISVESVENSILQRTDGAGIKGRYAILGPVQFFTGLPFDLLLGGAGDDAANTAFHKVTETHYQGSNGSTIDLASHQWTLSDISASSKYVCPEAVFPSQWFTAGGADPAPSLVSADVTQAIQIGLSGSPQIIGIRIVAANSQAANLQEWCDEHGLPVTWVDNNGNLFLRYPSSPFQAATKQYVDDAVAGGGGGGTSVGSTWNIPDASSGDTVAGLGLTFTPTRVIPVVRSPSGGIPLFASVIDGTVTSDGFNFILGPGITDSANYKLDFQLVRPSEPSGVWSIPDSSSGDTVTGLGLGFTPSQVIPVVRAPSGGVPLFASVVDGTVTADGFDFILGPGITDSANYKLDFRMIQ